MNKEELEAQSLFQEMQKKEALLNEFQNLKPNWKGSAIRFVSTLAAIAYLVWMFPEIMDQPILYVLLLLIFGVSAEIHNESKRINKRIDLLHRLFQSDV
uniref:hypothetical protein n=1 Tax=Alteromonas sp. S015 TaxID=3117401 RepID=UPI002FE2518A